MNIENIDKLVADLGDRPVHFIVRRNGQKFEGQAFLRRMETAEGRVWALWEHVTPNSIKPGPISDPSEVLQQDVFRIDSAYLDYLSEPDGAGIRHLDLYHRCPDHDIEPE